MLSYVCTFGVAALWRSVDYPAGMLEVVTSRKPLQASHSTSFL